ncbi:Inosine-uridine preferring nucleoside hydrolase family protein [Synechococcus sp. JA-2-3B'a(2-13)]|jgi:purine nucleosidase|uniref:nucleoside hydrolase n=1 Tax=unclassified Synechococcus TaxID=2626047 RepID=UPI0000694B42|nr:nucleoside hydrolase [Synechococcus sp. JA-2-3B'a(2-13)]ABD01484.1 Inosine-uridine preferring nucleoside hydrolase family protein [Synechococcus sp. JA-2-3B'a(2-13)]
MVPLIIDCDPGQDDAVALLLAMASPEELQLLGITTVAGNVSLDKTSRNARQICELAGQPQMGVYAGCPRPLLRPLETAEQVHGKTGIDGADLPEPQMPLGSQHAVEYLIETLMAAPEPVTLALLGPMTNLAVALVQQPRIVERIQRLVFMGGSAFEGNVTPAAEFNILTDPHAAQIVLSAGIPEVVMLGLHVTQQVLSTPERIERIRALGTRVGQTVANMLTFYGKVDVERYGLPGGPLHDPCVIAYLLQPQLFELKPCYVEVETASPLNLGRTVVDRWGSSGRLANVQVAFGVDAQGFYHLLTERLGRYR